MVHMYIRKFLSTVIIVAVIVFATASTIAAPDLQSFFGRDGFDLPPLLKDIKFGMSESEIQRIIPEFKQNYYFKAKGNEDIQVAKDMSGGSLTAIYIDLALDLTKTSSFLQQKWERSLLHKNLMSETEYHWLSEKKGIRAKLEKQSNSSQLSYYQYIPIQTLFPQNIPSLPTPIEKIKIGSSVANIKKISPDFTNKEYPDVNWTNLRGYFDVRIWYFSENKSTIDSLDLSFPNIENVRGILVKKWGMPKKSPSGQEYWKNDNIEYLDAKGKPKQGIFIIYQAEPEGYSHSLKFQSSLT
jgi:hypothetical protein